MRSAKRLPLDALSPYLLELPTEVGTPLPRLDWVSVFGNTKPVEIEVGFGKGSWLIDEVVARPDANYLGIEFVRGLQLYVATRLAKRQVTNARVSCGDARFILQTFVPSASVAALHVYFPDPWWKKRHKKRRVFSEQFAAEAKRILLPQGRLHIATDVEEYFGVMTELVIESQAFQEITRRIETGVPDAEESMTNFERKARVKGGQVWCAEFSRRDVP